MALQMSKNARRMAAAAVAVAGVVAVGSLSMAGGATAKGDHMRVGWPRTGGGVSSARATAGAQGADLVVRAVQTRGRDIDLGRAGESPGDFNLFEERLYKPGTHNVVGRDTARCELGITTIQCDATFKILGNGKIVIAGALFADQDNTLVITGGTGRYAGLGGSMRFFDGPGNSTRLAFYFDG